MKNPRTALAIALFLPLAAILITTFACLPVPVGDPETSKIDANLSGIYRLQPADPADKTVALAILKPWDARTYLLDYLNIETKDGKEDRQLQHYKCWLTTLAGKTFITCQPMDDLQFVLGGDKKPVYPVLRLDKTPAGLEVRLVNPESEFLKNLTKQADFEAAIQAHATDQALYGDPATFKKLAKEDQAFIEETVGKFNKTQVGKINVGDLP